MKKYFHLIPVLLFSFNITAQPFNDGYKRNETIAYADLIDAYKTLDSISPQMRLMEYGKTDGGYPLHLFLIDKTGKFEKAPNRKAGESAMLIMNGIHPGECEGIDASLLIAQQMAYGKMAIPENVVIGIIPVYNVDGMLNRKAHTRTNQNGPLEKGFRGNARNFDLNRDFIKADTKNTFAFYRMFHDLDPDVFMDTHTSNGADYQYTMTLVATLHEKLGGHTAAFLYDSMLPALYTQMEARNSPMIPYVHLFGKSPDEEGYEQFIDGPKYSSGFTALFGTLGLLAETHMLKPYPARVEATVSLLQATIVYTQAHGEAIHEARLKDIEQYKTGDRYLANFTIDKSKHATLLFKGYEAERSASKIGNYQRLSYNRKKPYTKEIPYYNAARPALEVKLPVAYIIPRAWTDIIERLRANHVTMTRVNRDTVMDLYAYYITNYESSAQPYEGHHANFHTEVEKRKVGAHLVKGDYIVYANQHYNRYICEVLEPQTEDGFFSWNFFDPILNAKEGFSDYVFEDDALKLLDEDAALKKKFEEWKVANPDKVSNGREVLSFIFRNSKLYEAEHMRFPVYRLE